MILLDSHVLLWVLVEPELVSSSAVAVIQSSVDAQQAPGVSILSLYELSRAIHRGRVSTVVSAEEFLRRAEAYALVLPVTSAIAITAAQLPASFPSDPFDRLIAATALIEGVPLVTADQNIRRSRALRTIW